MRRVKVIVVSTERVQGGERKGAIYEKALEYENTWKMEPLVAPNRRKRNNHLEPTGGIRRRFAKTMITKPLTCYLIAHHSWKEIISTPKRFPDRENAYHRGGWLKWEVFVIRLIKHLVFLPFLRTLY